MVPELLMARTEEGAGRFVGSRIARFDVDELDDLGQNAWKLMGACFAH